MLLWVEKLLRRISSSTCSRCVLPLSHLGKELLLQLGLAVSRELFLAIAVGSPCRATPEGAVEAELSSGTVQVGGKEGQVLVPGSAGHAMGT